MLNSARLLLTSLFLLHYSPLLYRTLYHTLFDTFTHAFARIRTIRTHTRSDSKVKCFRSIVGGAGFANRTRAFD